MSTTSSPRARWGAALPRRPRLTVVAPLVRPRSRASFVVLVIAVLATGLIGLLLLNTQMERGAFALTGLRDESAALAQREQALQVDVADLEQPQALAARAVRLGMVPDPGNAFLELSGGGVRGYSAAGAQGTQIQVGDTSVPNARKLAKVAPVVGGEHATGALVHAIRTVPPAAGAHQGTSAHQGTGTTHHTEEKR